MLKVHNKIIKEIVEENKKDSKVVSILLYGNLARAVANKNSDVDIEIVYEGGKYKDISKKRYGIKVDLEYWPKKKLLDRIEKYPFLSYPYLEEKILYDPKVVMKKIKYKLNKYFKDNPEVLKEWKNWLKEYLSLKNKWIKRTEKERPKSCKEFYDKLEIKFSKEHKITRKF